MYDLRPNLIIGFHGCDESKALQLVNSPNKMKFSREKFDWLGHGFYFWENNYERAKQWAQNKKKKGLIEKPAVVGALLNLGHCCDFIDSKFTSMIKDYYSLMANRYEVIGEPLPKNKDIKKDKHKDKLLRELDCAVIEFMHSEIYQERTKKTSHANVKKQMPFDSVRAVFDEGGPAFTGAGIASKSHIQVCIRNSDCIKGFFLPRKATNFMSLLEKKKGRL